MNERGRKRGLSEPEVLRIFTDVCEALHCLHSQKPPIIHRDIKVENVLIGRGGEFKLCDFGSIWLNRVSPKSASIAAIEEDVQRCTTVPYRAPELIDLYSGKTITVKADVWVRQSSLARCRHASPRPPSFSASRARRHRDRLGVTCNGVRPWHR